MSTLKLIFVIIISAAVLLILLIIYALSPTVRNVSDAPPLKPYLKQLKTKRVTYLNTYEKGQYDFVENQLHARPDYPGRRIAGLPAGTVLSIHKFKTYTNNLGAGFTYLYALGDVTTAGGRTFSFEYNIASVEKDLYGTEAYALPLTAWQDSTDAPIELPAKE